MNKSYISRLWTKKQTQECIKALRAQGLPVEKIDGGYVLAIKDQEIFKAMNGSNGYLVRYVSDLFGA